MGCAEQGVIPAGGFSTFGQSPNSGDCQETFFSRPTETGSPASHNSEDSTSLFAARNAELDAWWNAQGIIVDDPASKLQALITKLTRNDPVTRRASIAELASATSFGVSGADVVDSIFPHTLHRCWRIRAAAREALVCSIESSVECAVAAVKLVFGQPKELLQQQFPTGFRRYFHEAHAVLLKTLLKCRVADDVRVAIAEAAMLALQSMDSRVREVAADILGSSDVPVGGIAALEGAAVSDPCPTVRMAAHAAILRVMRERETEVVASALGNAGFTGAVAACISQGETHNTGTGETTGEDFQNSDSTVFNDTGKGVTNARATEVLLLPSPPKPVADAVVSPSVGRGAGEYGSTEIAPLANLQGTDLVEIAEMNDTSDAVSDVDESHDSCKFLVNDETVAVSGCTEKKSIATASVHQGSNCTSAATDAITLTRKLDVLSQGIVDCDATVRCEAMRALAAISEELPSSVPARLADVVAPVRRTAAALLRQPVQAAVRTDPQLHNTIKDPCDWWPWRAGVLLALETESSIRNVALSSLSRPGSMPASAFVRRCSMLAVGGESEKALPRAFRSLDSGWWRERSKAVEALHAAIRHGDGDVVSGSVVRLSSTSSRLRKSCAEVLSSFSGSGGQDCCMAVTEALVACVSDPIAEVRSAAAQALVVVAERGGMSTSGVKGLVDEYFTGRSSDVRREAASCLVALARGRGRTKWVPQAVADYIVACIYRGISPAARLSETLAILGELAPRGHEGTVNVTLHLAFHSRDAGVRMAALDALGSVGDESDPRLRSTAVRCISDVDEIVRDVAEELLERLGPPVSSSASY